MKQDGLLCGQHCLNNLLQGQYFTAVDLADIAQQMDQAEQRHMAELGMHTDDFRRFMEVCRYMRIAEVGKTRDMVEGLSEGICENGVIAKYSQV